MEQMVAVGGCEIPKRIMDRITVLKRCPKCGEPTEISFVSGGEVRGGGVVCPCRKAELDLEREGFEKKQRAEHVMSLRETAYMDKSLRECTFENDDRKNKKLTDIATRYAVDFDKHQKDGKGLLLYGGVGTGKTFMAACIVNALVTMNIPAHISTMENLIHHVNGGRHDEHSQRLWGLRQYDLLVIDDFGRQGSSEYMTSRASEIIDARYDSHKPTIITTNLTPQQLSNPDNLDAKRMFSRIAEMCEPVDVTLFDRRLKKASERSME